MLTRQFFSVTFLALNSGDQSLVPVRAPCYGILWLSAKAAQPRSPVTHGVALARQHTLPH